MTGVASGEGEDGFTPGVAPPPSSDPTSIAMQLAFRVGAN
jgi:hypothetical protein